MTDTSLNEKTLETSTVDVDLEKQTARITSPKHKTDYVVGKLRSQIFFQVATTKSIIPSALSGKYTSLDSAISAVLEHIKNTKETFAVRSDRLHEERQQRKHAESHSKNS